MNKKKKKGPKVPLGSFVFEPLARKERYKPKYPRPNWEHRPINSYAWICELIFRVIWAIAGTHGAMASMFNRTGGDITYREMFTSIGNNDRAVKSWAKHAGTKLSSTKTNTKKNAVDFNQVIMTAFKVYTNPAFPKDLLQVKFNRRHDRKEVEKAKKEGKPMPPKHVMGDIDHRKLYDYIYDYCRNKSEMVYGCLKHK